MDTPDPRAKALQRVDVRPDRWLINVAVAALIGTAYRAAPRDAAAAPAFIPHTRPEGGPLWFAEPHIHLIGDIPDSSAPSAARGIVEGVLFADRVIIESCIGAGQRTLYVSGAFGADPELPAASNHSSAISASATDLIYVSRLLTDSALDRLHTLGIPVRTGQEAPPSRAELEAGIRQRRRSHPRPDGQPRAEQRHRIPRRESTPHPGPTEAAQQLTAAPRSSRHPDRCPGGRNRRLRPAEEWRGRCARGGTL